MIKHLLMASALAVVSLIGVTASAHPWEKLDQVARAGEGRETFKPAREAQRVMVDRHRIELSRVGRPPARVVPNHEPIVEGNRVHVSRPHSVSGRATAGRNIIQQKIEARTQSRARCADGHCGANQSSRAVRPSSGHAEQFVYGSLITLPRDPRTFNGTGDKLHEMRIKFKNDRVKGHIASVVARHQHPGKECAAKGTDYGAVSGAMAAKGIASRASSSTQLRAQSVTNVRAVKNMQDRSVRSTVPYHTDRPLPGRQ